MNSKDEYTDKSLILTGNFHIYFVPKMRRVRVVVFNASFNNISVISWRSVFLMEETSVPGENDV